MTFQELELSRKAYKKRLLLSGIISFFIIFLLIILFFIIFDIPLSQISLIGYLLLPLLLASSLAYLFSKKQARAYEKSYKAYFVETTLKKSFTNLQYNHNTGYSRDYINEIGLLNTADRFSSNDFTTAKYKDVQFSQADVHIEEEHTDSEGRSSYTTIFLGRYIVYEFNRDFNFNLQIFGNRFYAVGGGGRNIKNRKYEKFKTESSEFNKCFRIRAQDGFETFYLLDPSFIEKIQQLYEYSKGRIALGFTNKQLHIAISNGKDSFEPPRPFKSINEQAEFEKVSADIKIITDFVDTLKLDKNIFKK